MVLRMARCRARTFSGPSAARRSSISSRASAMADADRGCAVRDSEQAAEDKQFDETVAAETVGAVQAARRLADGVQAADVRAVVLRAHPHPAHRVVRGRRVMIVCRGRWETSSHTPPLGVPRPSLISV
jgi:hypothetical protein